MEGWDKQHLFLGKSFSLQQPGERACCNIEHVGIGHAPLSSKPLIVMEVNYLFIYIIPQTSLIMFLVLAHVNKILNSASQLPIRLLVGGHSIIITQSAPRPDCAVVVSCLELLFGVLLLRLVKVLYQTVTYAPSGSRSGPLPWSNDLI
jgi:hypothetical protein